MENQKPAFSAAEPSVRFAAGKRPEANSAGSVKGSSPSYQSSGGPEDIGAVRSRLYLRDAPRGPQPPNLSRRILQGLVVSVVVPNKVVRLVFCHLPERIGYRLSVCDVMEGWTPMWIAVLAFNIVRAVAAVIELVLFCFSLYHTVVRRREAFFAQDPSILEDVRPVVMEYANRAQLEQYFRIARVLSEHPDEVNAILGEGHGLSMLEVAQCMYERVVIDNRQSGVSSGNSYGETMNLVKSARQGRQTNCSVPAAGSTNTYELELDDLPGGHNGA